MSSRRTINPAPQIGEQIISRSPERMSGTPVFAGTRVPIKTLFDYLQADDALARFLDHFPTVEREQAVVLLAQIGEQLDASEDGNIHIS